MGRKRDLTGQVFGKLTAIKRCEDHFTTGGNRYSQYSCRCECGEMIKVRSDRLVSGHTRSCGCERKRSVREMSTSHGQSKTRLYRIWAHMKQRCLTESDKNYADYGGRGITICAEWANSYEVFRKWAMDSGYSDALTIDRIDVNRGYDPQNCRWSTTIEQMNNTRKNRKIEYLGQEKTVAEWARVIGVPYNTLFSRLYRYGWPIDKASKYAEKACI